MNPPTKQFQSSPIIVLLPSGRTVTVNLCSCRFILWRGPAIQDTYGGKAVLDYGGEPLFAELAILRMLQNKGWDGAWVDTYRRKYRQHLPPHSYDLPALAREFLDRANTGRKWPSGCFDVLAWKDGTYLFIEAKRSGRDAIRRTQKAWLESALETGLTLDTFSIIEWSV